MVIFIDIVISSASCSSWGDPDGYGKQKVDKINVIQWEAMNRKQREAWMNYRQKLLDITGKYRFPFSVEWPEEPD